MKILNLDNRDYHMHSNNFSDGFSSVDEIVRFAGEIGLTEIAITDHSDATLDFFQNQFGFFPSTARYNLAGDRWQNVFNGVNVIFGVEGDLLNENGDTCFTIQGLESDFKILSLHDGIYCGDVKKTTQGLIKAIEKNYNQIKLIGHPCYIGGKSQYYDIKQIVEVANNYNIPLEFNAKNIHRGKTDLEKLDYMLRNADEIYINSDAHTLYDLKESRKFAIKYLKENNYI
ncbi:MAG: PHP domain-containing protein [Candidatus Gracilibacteria bacterium]|nr:PHP domain-containing protein [Candidatus Gracilibacteria bacterium]